jgi:two-component system, chemotaxis family, sensor kinase CheA
MPSTGDASTAGIAIEAATGPAALDRGPEWTVQLGESYVRELAEWLTTTNSTIRLVRYTPAEDCYFRGEDPLLLVRQLPGIDRLLVRMPPVVDLETFNEFHCDLEFVLSTRASPGELTYLLRYVPDQTEVVEVGAAALLAALEPPAAGAASEQSTVDSTAVKDRDAVADAWFLLAGAMSALSAGSGQDQLMSVARSARTAADLLGLDTAELATAETAEQARDALRALLAQQMTAPTATYHPDPEPEPTPAPVVVEVSGRGAGMDAVRASVERLGGTVTLRSTPGQGSLVRLRLPLSRAVATVTGTVEIAAVGELVGWLRGTDRPKVDLRHATHLHAAAIRAMVAFGAEVSSPPVDPFLVQHVLPLLREPAALAAGRARPPAGR